MAERREGQGRRPVTARTVWRWVLVCVAVSGAALLIDLVARYGASEPLSALSAESVTAWIKSFGPGAAVASCLVMIACALTILPAEVPALANGMLYGPVLGGALTWAGAMVGANIAFAIARLFGPGLVDRVVTGEKSQRYQKVLEENGAIVLLIARCVPLVPFFAVNYLAGAASMRLWTFNWVTAIGILPMTVALVTMGDQAMRMPWTSWLALGAVLIAIVIALRWALRRFAGG